MMLIRTCALTVRVGSAAELPSPEGRRWCRAVFILAGWQQHGLGISAGGVQWQCPAKKTRFCTWNCVLSPTC